MIPATQPHVARFRQTAKRADGSTHDYFTTKPVIAWDDDGRPLVVGKQSLVAADSYMNFHDVQPGAAPVVGVIPSDGWVAEYKDGDDMVTSKVVAWTVDAKGEMTPLTLDAGYCDDATDPANFVRIYHPDEELPQ